MSYALEKDSWTDCLRIWEGISFPLSEDLVPFSTPLFNKSHLDCEQFSTNNFSLHTLPETSYDMSTDLQPAPTVANISSWSSAEDAQLPLTSISIGPSSKTDSALPPNNSCVITDASLSDLSSLIPPSLAPLGTLAAPLCSAAISVSSQDNHDTKDCLRFVLLNTWSLPKHSLEVSDYIVENNVDILALTETWLSDASGPALATAVPPEYCIIIKNRIDKKGDGVAFIYKKTLNIHEAVINDIDGCELIHAKLLVNPVTTYNLLLIYRPPQDMPLFEEHLQAILMPLLKSSSKAILCGDFNLWLNSDTDLPAQSLAHAISDLGFQVHSLGPTHRAGNSLDWLCSLNIAIDDIATAPCVWSDHFFVQCTIPLVKRVTTSSCKKQITHMRNFSKITNDSITPFLMPFKDLVHSPDSPNKLANIYTSTLTEATNSLAPLKKRHTTAPRKRLLHFSSDIIALRATKRAAHRAWQKNPSIEEKQIYTSALKNYRDAIILAKKSHYETRIADAESDSKEIFRILRELENPDLKPLDVVIRDKTWCSHIQDAMLGKVSKLKSDIKQRQAKIPPSSTNSPSPVLDIKPFTFSPVTEADMATVIASLKPTSCKGDICPAVVIKKCAPSLILLITRFVNASFSTSTVPSNIKQSWISPLLKKPSLDPSVPTNFRPITNVPFLLKILDRVAYLQILRFVQDNHLLSTRQSGFRIGHGTESALLDLKSSLHQMVDRGELSLLMLLDLSAAFDLVDYDILVERLQSSAKFSKEAAGWIQSFLTGRTARVFHLDAASDPVALTCGVPQGACISPMLYNLFTRPLFDLLDKNGILYTNYADDTQVVLRLVGDHYVDTTHINNVFALIQEWMDVNGLALNDSKTELLLIGSPGKLKTLPDEYKNFNIAGCTIPVADKVKTLGVYFDSTLNMNAHVKYLSSSTSYYIRLLYQLRPLLSKTTCATVARAIVGAKLDYCCSLLGGSSKYNQKKLQTLQNSAVRVVSSLGRTEHVTQARKELHWLPVDARIKFRILAITHKTLFGSAPEYLKNRISFRTEVRTLRSTNTNLLHVPRFKLKTGGCLSFDYISPQLWNSLPPDLRCEGDLLKFRKLLKTFLFA